MVVLKHWAMCCDVRERKSTGVVYFTRFTHVRDSAAESAFVVLQAELTIRSVPNIEDAATFEVCHVIYNLRFHQY